MGIRFVCPNGHALNVKEELAGKRGVCPHCQARFLIPSPSDGEGDESALAASSQTPPMVESPISGPPTATVSPPGAVPPRVPAGTAQPARAPRIADQPITWYIRPVGGGQFGPADEELMRLWMAEGRVGNDAYVWRTGWTDWCRVAEVTDRLPGGGGQTVASQVAMASASEKPATDEESPAPAAAALARYQRRKKQSAKSQLAATIVLVTLVVILAGVLIWVLRRSSTSTATENPPPAAVSTHDE